MDYSPNMVIEATPIMEGRPHAGTSNIRVTPFLVEVARTPSIVDSFLEQDASSASGHLARRSESAKVRENSYLRHQTAKSEDALTLLARRRLALFQARNASTQASVELLERLRILNERMNRQSPRVTDAHIQSIEDAVALGERVSSRMAERMARLSK